MNSGRLAQDAVQIVSGVATVLTLLFAPPAHAEQRAGAQTFKFDREVLPRPEFDAEEEAPPSLGLPVFKDFAPASPLSGEAGFKPLGFRVIGSTVFSEAQLTDVLRPFLGRALRSEDLPSITDTLTRLYVDAGYLSSGARIPDQALSGGIVEIEIVEGASPALMIEEGGRLRPHYVEHRLRDGLKAPLNLDALERSLRRLQMDPRIDRVDAVLIPAGSPGASLLQLKVAEANPWEMDFRFANDLSPSLGENRASANLLNWNMLGFGDRFHGVVSGARGLVDLDLAYAIPFTPWLTEFELRGGFAKSEIVEGDFDGLFENEIESYGISLKQPLYLTLEDSIRARIGFERRTSQLLFDGGDDLALETGFGQDSEIHLSLLHITLDWVHRETDRIFAAQLRTTFGLDVWDATTPNNRNFRGVDEAALPDAEFTSWLLQLQYAQRIETLLGDAELVARGDLQMATGALFSLESFAMGGASTTRGYRENLVVSDNGMLVSIEFRVPVLPARYRPHEIRLAPFLDTGIAWDDHDRATQDFDRSFVGIGFGVLYRYAERFEINAYWGRGLRSPELGSGGDTQKLGFHLKARLAVF